MNITNLSLYVHAIWGLPVAGGSAVVKQMAAAFRGALICSLLCVPSLAFLVDSEMQPRNCLDSYEA